MLRPLLRDHRHTFRGFVYQADQVVFNVGLGIIVTELINRLDHLHNWILHDEFIGHMYIVETEDLRSEAVGGPRVVNFNKFAHVQVSTVWSRLSESAVYR